MALLKGQTLTRENLNAAYLSKAMDSTIFTNLTTTGTIRANALVSDSSMTISGSLNGITITPTQMSADNSISILAGGTNQNVSLIPSGTGAVLLGTKVGIGAANPGLGLDIQGGDLKLSDTVGGNSYTLKVISGANAMWLSSPTTQSTVNLSTGYNNDYAMSIKYTPGTIGALAGLLTIGQLSKNNANYTHGITALYTNGSERMRINKDGYMGIGVTDPKALLHLSTTGATQLLMTDSDAVVDSKHKFIESDNGTLLIGKYNDAVTTPVTQMTLDLAGNLGIGVTPASVIPTGMAANARLLEIANDTSDTGILIRTSGTTYGADIWADYSDGNIYFDSRGNADTANINFRTKTAGTAINAMTILGNGRVGIGTPSPVAPLDLYYNGAINSPMLSIRADFTAIGKYAMIRFGDKTQTTDYQKGAIIYEGVSGAARGRFHIALNNTDDSASVTLSDAKLTVLSDGSVGIGTTAPQSTLQVGNNTVASNAISITSTAAGTTSLSFDDTAVGRGLIKYTHTDDTMALYTAAIERMKINATGNITMNSPTAGTVLTIGRLAGQPTIKANSDGSGWIIADSSGAGTGSISLNHYVTDHVFLAGGGGKVGIGMITTPGAKLEVVGDIKATAINIPDPGTSGTQLLKVGDEAFITDVDIANTLGIYGIADSTKGALKLGSAGATISGYSNRIGIGTAAPEETLHVAGNLKVDGTIAGTVQVTYGNYQFVGNATEDCLDIIYIG